MIARHWEVIHNFYRGPTSVEFRPLNAKVIASAPGKGAGVCDKSAAGRSQTVDFKDGEMSEWLKEHAWKACVGETLPWVRIPLSPPTFRCKYF